jgi:glyoxylase-like metal-dependent hydrolase (beta-lactamase superfamily II)
MAKGAAVLPSGDTGGEDIYHIWCLRYGRVAGRRVHDNFAIRDMHDGPMPLDLYVWILRNRQRTVLVDTGFSERAAVERNHTIDFNPVDGLARLGLPPETVEDVVITHLHFDHAGNMDRFPKAQFHIQDAEVAFATGRCMCDRFLRRPFDVEDIVTLVRNTYAGRVTFHDGDAAPFPGVTLHCLPGHSKGVQAVRVKTPRGPVLLASDVSHYYANFLRRAPFSLTVDAIATLKAYSRLMELTGGEVERIIPGHDPKVRSLYPSHSFGGLEVQALHETPRHHDIEALKALDGFPG